MAITLFAMPSSSALMLFSVVLGLVKASPYTLPTQTAAYIANEWTPRPTVVPVDPAVLFKRGGSVDIAVCGWVSGVSSNSAVCMSGSSCIHDTAHQVMGCCATDGPCTDGVYTTCVDKKSPGWASTTGQINNGVTTCNGDSLCYQNTYPGNYMQFTCGDSTAPAQILTTFSGQPTDMRMQQVYSGITFSPMAPAPSPIILSGAPISASAPAASPTTANSNAFAPGVGAVVSQAPSIMAAPSTSPSSAPGKGPNPGAIAGGTAGAVALVTIAVLLSFWCYRRRQKASKSEQPQTLFDPARKDPFARSLEPVQHYHAPEEVVSPMTGMREVFPPFPGRPDTPASSQHPFHYDTAYAGSGGGMAIANALGQNRQSFSTVAEGNPFADEEPHEVAAPPLPTNRRVSEGARDIVESRYFDAPPVPTSRSTPPEGRAAAESRYFDDHHPYADSQSLHDSPRLVDDTDGHDLTEDHPFADVAASNPFADADGHDTTPAQALTQQSLRPLSMGQRSQRTMTSAHTQPLVDEIDDFSRSWQASAASHRDPSEQSEYEDEIGIETEDKSVVRTAISLSVAHGHLISTRSYEALSHMGSNPDEREENAMPRSRPSSMDHPALQPSTPETAKSVGAASIPVVTPPTMQEKIQKLAQEKAQVVRERTESQEQRREEVEEELKKSAALRQRPTSGASTYSSNTLVSQQPSLLSPGLSQSPRRSSFKRAGSFGLNNAIKPALEEDLGGEDMWAFGWSGIGGGWLEAQSGQSSMIGEPPSEPRASFASSSLAPTARKPIGGSSLSMNNSAELPDTPKKNTSP